MKKQDNFVQSGQRWIRGKKKEPVNLQALTDFREESLLVISCDSCDLI